MRRRGIGCYCAKETGMARKGRARLELGTVGGKTHSVPSQRAWMRMRRRKERAERRFREAMAAAADRPMLVQGEKERRRRNDRRHEKRRTANPSR
jgi:hypothetical protein